MPVSDLKRKSDSLVVASDTKKLRNELTVLSAREKAVATASNVVRTSKLFAPIMLLEGHQGDVFSADFHPDGEYLASTGFDRQIYIWSVYGECENISSLKGHSGAVMELHFSPDGGHIYTCSTDHMLGIWDVQTGQRMKKMRGHTAFVNSVQGARRGPRLLVSGGDDSTIRLWDARKRNCINSYDAGYQVTAVTFNDTSEQIISGGIDNDIKIWDVRKNNLLMKLKGHTDTVTGLSLSPDGSYILSNSMDNTLRIWDIRAFVTGDRCLKVFSGHHHNYEKNLLRCTWSLDGSKVSCGSADRFLYIWDTTSRRILYKLPGHNGSVNDVKFHPNEPIILSASSDKTLYLGEIE
ncbi:U5 small nuclear ribonucleoprotein 40 kDa protein isoform X1 [Ctenocephalides felis]|uniref:U5 small nuclear ribonucleoprotein 40 kDa protein isoform X1 n=1 Tax=Ctenocephalides felis TaxID=7515 RepID=UPI000E6E5130|nr:U5 small nuclear ribonucleoprotein 40 kDa protein isoform X1 [Ctenocephalides felis]